MIDYFFGKPRTGKTYRAVKIIYDDYILNEKTSPKFQNILTNIGGFNFKEINQLFTDRGSQSVAYKLNWKNFHEHLRVMHKMALDDKDDDELNRYAYSHKINNCLIVIDEASLYMKRHDDALSWYLSYHGHFKVRIVIIAQSPKQIAPDYLVHAEIYIEAQPQSKQLTNGKLRYLHYSDSYFSKDNKFSSDIINTKKEIYDLYKSGEIDKPKKFLYKFIFYMILALVVMVSLFKLLMYRLTPETVENKNINTSSSDKEAYYKDDISAPVHLEEILINIRCNDKHCWNPNPKFEKNQISYTYFKYVILTNKLEMQFSEITNKVYITTPQKRAVSISTLTKLTDYYYFISKSIQKTYLSTLFIPKLEETQDRSIPRITNFMTETGANEDRGAP